MHKGLRCGDCISWTRAGEAATLSARLELLVCSFNIERGYNRADQAQFIRQKNFDIVLLQEVDIGCKRTDSANVFEEIATASQTMNYGVYAVEFEELDSPKRSKRLAGGGVHGNAILSRFPITAHGSIIHKQFYDWERSASEPRYGTRISVWADIEVDNRSIRVYSSHLENFCGALERLEQLQEVADHYRSTGEDRPMLVGGDLNTLMHGWIRFLPGVYPCRDTLFRFWTSLGWSEAAWWEKTLKDDALFKHFEDGFDKDDPTFVNLIHVYSAKLDWLLFDRRRFEILESHKGADGLSDHLAIWNRVLLKRRHVE